MPSDRGSSAAARGRLGEDEAARLLARNGYAVLERNVATPVGEIDLVARDGDTLCFVEVKARASRDRGSPEEAVTPRKQRQVRNAAAAYLAARGLDPERCRFDVVAIDLDAEGRCVDGRLLKDAFA